jgi:threonine/homoserine/homoserine lactone efflux protein
MAVVFSFLLAFFFSFVGTIPPGSVNLTIIQLGLSGKIKIAWRFALTVSIVEYPYAWLAIEFESLITHSQIVIEHFRLLAAIVMLIIGILNLISATGQRVKKVGSFDDSGIRRGLLLGILNPLAMPFWIGITAYLKSLHLIALSSPAEIHAYLLGVSGGTLILLMALAYLARNVQSRFERNNLLRVVPGATLIALGLLSFISWFF